MKRIQQKRTKGWRAPPGSVYVGRPSKWGNPFNWSYWFECGHLRKRDARQHVVDQFRRCMTTDDRPLCEGGEESINWMLEHLHELRGKDLRCWCPLDEPCHADVLLELANR